MKFSNITFLLSILVIVLLFSLIYGSYDSKESFFGKRLTVDNIKKVKMNNNIDDLNKQVSDDLDRLDKYIKNANFSPIEDFVSNYQKPFIINSTVKNQIDKLFGMFGPIFHENFYTTVISIIHNTASVQHLGTMKLDPNAPDPNKNASDNLKKIIDNLNSSKISDIVKRLGMNLNSIRNNNLSISSNNIEKFNKIPNNLLMKIMSSPVLSRFFQNIGILYLQNAKFWT